MNSSKKNEKIVNAMAKIHRVNDTEEIQKIGYRARYTADIEFDSPIDSMGMILVEVLGNKTQPHAHNRLKEIFLAMSPLIIHVNEKKYHLQKGDIVIVEPGEVHSFESAGEGSGYLLAMKAPNDKTDKTIRHQG